LQEKPDCIDAHRGLAAIYFDQGTLIRALRHCEEWARLDPHDGRPLRFMGHINKDLGKDSEAIAAFKEALQRDLGQEFQEDVKENLAEVQVRESRHADALQTLDDCAVEAAQKPKLAALRAECLWALRPASEAALLLDQAIKSNPNSPALLRLRAGIYLQEENQPRAAAALLERAVTIDRHDQISRLWLAQAYERLGKSAEATEQRRLAEQTQDLLREMTKLSHDAMIKPWNPDLRNKLAEVSEKFDRPDLAEMWRQAARAMPALREAASSHASVETDRFTSTQSRTRWPWAQGGQPR
jgi:tetratricopeptide (TPR) repeat protein